MSRHRTHDRDSSLLRLSRANRWLLASSLALTGLLTDVVAHAFPSKAHASTPTKGSHAGRGHGAHGDGHSSTTTHALKPPADPPQASEPAEPASEAASEPSPEATRESAPAESPSTPVEEPAPEAAPEPQPTPEPAPEAEAPVVSGGS